MKEVEERFKELTELASAVLLNNQGADPEARLKARSLKPVLVLPPQIFGPFGPPKKRINFDKFNQRHISA